jgi:hypothetical protein
MLECGHDLCRMVHSLAPPAKGLGQFVAQLRLPGVMWRVTAGSFLVAQWYPAAAPTARTS